MRKSLLNFFKHFIIIVTALFFLGGEAADFGKGKTFFHGFLIRKPIIDIGLGVNLSQAAISSSSGMKIYEVKNDYRLIAEEADQALVKGHKEKLSEKFLIQVGQYEDAVEAEEKAGELSTQLRREVTVRHSPDTEVDGSYKLLIGDFITRGDALDYIVKLNRLGFTDNWIVKEEITIGQSRPLWILVNDKLISLKEDTVLFFIPSKPQSYLSYKGRDYRGILTLRAGRKGLALINTLHIEDYLKAVVPSELSPYVFPELEAHKALAVAARTYAMKNLGQNDTLGFDLDDTPRTQFYKGMNAEHPLSTQAVEETRGEVARFKGKLIDALYTSTCGGATENVENVFLGPALPYLRSTECIYEKQKEWEIATDRVIPPVYVHGRNISPDIALLNSLGITPEELQPAYFREEISAEEVVEWVEAARSQLGKTAVYARPADNPAGLEAFLKLARDAFGWRERTQNLLRASETEFIVNGGDDWSEESRATLAYFFQAGIIPSLEDLGDPDHRMSHGETVFYLARIMKSYRDFTQQGVFKGFAQDRMQVQSEDETVPLDLTSSAYLIMNYGGQYSLVSNLHLLGGENIRWIGDQDRVAFLEVVYPAYSNILDRSSRYHSWQVRYSREDLSRRINRFYPIGELIDLVPRKIGQSNRVVELSIEGTETQTIVKGLRIRRVLGVRETLFVIDRERDDQGGITHIHLSGKGWGHGVGLCQVGAVGMAQSGAAYKDILKKYYRGIKVSKAY